jgi:hypothetical protein
MSQIIQNHIYRFLRFAYDFTASAGAVLLSVASHCPKDLKRIVITDGVSRRITRVEKVLKIAFFQGIHASDQTIPNSFDISLCGQLLTLRSHLLHEPAANDLNIEWIAGG